MIYMGKLTIRNEGNVELVSYFDLSNITYYKKVVSSDEIDEVSFQF